ncbi:MAG: Gfo/Idh/MocA family oxidoreductase [Leptospiraceae bacterium]|nr:Gfo/Idh/MocA family oxidoreductase [Leptospiraceae bacterium]
MKNKKLKAGIIGLGVGEAHMNGYDSHPDCEVIAICDFNQDKELYAKQKFPKLKFYNNSSDLLNDSEVDVVSIASFDNYHYEEILLAIENNKHIFIEKPLCLYSHEARVIRNRLNEKPNIKISSNLILRKSPRFIDLRKKILSGEMGTIFYLDGDYNYGRVNKLTNGWRGEIDYYSVILGGAVHLIDLILWLNGSRVREVSCFGNKISTKDTQFKHLDFAVALMKFENESNAKVSANFGCVYPHFHCLSVYGTEASFVNRKTSAEYFTSRDSSIEPELLNTEYPGIQKGDLIHSFLDDILGYGDSDVNKEDVFKTISVCFAMENSLRKNIHVPVEYI